MLPCKHIFYQLTKNQCSLYIDKIIQQRWTKEGYEQVHISVVVKSDVEAQKKTVQIPATKLKPTSNLNADEKYNRMLKISKRLANMASHMGTKEFEDMYTKMKTLEMELIGSSHKDSAGKKQKDAVQLIDCLTT